MKILFHHSRDVIIAGLSFYGDRPIDYQKWLYGDQYYLSPKCLRELFFICLILLNPLTTNIPHHIETSQLICNAMQIN